MALTGKGGSKKLGVHTAKPKPKPTVVTAASKAKMAKTLKAVDQGSKKAIAKGKATQAIAAQGGSDAMRDRVNAAARAREAVEGRVINLVSGRGNPGHVILGSTLTNSTARVKDGKRGDHLDQGDFDHMDPKAKISAAVTVGGYSGARAALSGGSSSGDDTTTTTTPRAEGKWKEVDWLGTAGNYGAEGRKKKKAGLTSVDRRTK